jgi:hypothetical protein
MRRLKIIPKTDIEKLSEEVLKRGSNSALPQNLPDRWLRAIARDFMGSQKAGLEGRGREVDEYLMAPILIVTMFVAVKQNISTDEASLMTPEIMAGLNRFEKAIQEEILGRETGIFINHYTIENIV